MSTITTERELLILTRPPRQIHIHEGPLNYAHAPASDLCRCLDSASLFMVPKILRCSQSSACLAAVCIVVLLLENCLLDSNPKTVLVVVVCLVFI